MRIIHWILGRFILFFDWITSPKGIKRAPEVQQQVDAQSKMLTLYQYKACPFCVKVRRTMKRLSLPIDLRDPKRDAQAKVELVEGSGKLKVPCLKIEHEQGETQWLFESKDIIQYLQQRFAKDSL